MEDLRERLAANLNDRDLGKALCALAQTSGGNGQTDEERISAFLSESYGLNTAPGVLMPLARDDAAFVAAELLLGPVWGPRPEDRTDAGEAASRFLAQFSETARFFSTYRFKINRINYTYTSSGVALLDNSFDMGVLAADGERVGVLWLGDED